uniref:Phospholipase D n=1 Tax=Ananas comosus var. bracteatus TaxID=296719 RepID=A0A6V7PVG8_ANACO|nr:unnamed protein product [Ananas comosus var. bracteatus]
MAQRLLHGILHATIFEADCMSMTTSIPSRPIQKTPTASKRRVCRIFSWIKRVSFCPPKVVEEIEDSIGWGEGSGKLYATVDVEKARVGRTRVISDELTNPKWNESFRIYCAHWAADIIFTIKSENPIGASLIGRAFLPVEDIINGEQVDRWLAICDEDRKPLEGGAKIHVRMQYLSVSKDLTANWGKGISSPRYPGVPHTFFPQRRDCRVTLYQDAHVPNNFSPRIPLSGGRYYEPHRCWEDIFDAITNARQLVYITGWSVYTNITLIRDPQRPKPGGNATLGELLKKKAAEGVRVLMLVWDDRTSQGLGPLRKDGLMATHDQDTERYFYGTDVHCILCPRNPDRGESYVQGLEVATMFTHHQKTVIVDYEVPAAGNKKYLTTTTRTKATRSILSFVGGIDLCDGRYDTQDHPLFRTLARLTVLISINPTLQALPFEKGGQESHGMTYTAGWKDRLSWAPAAIREDGEAWNVQVFRSIDGGAVVGFPEVPEDAAARGLVTGKDHVIERSIQDAYIQAIRRAKNFIYIENQYFLGSSYSWRPQDIKVEDIGALHLIPKELSLKIISKIEAGERFAVYVVIPMWPEGIPESASVQAILDWQRRTMEMMYADIAQAIRANGLQADPKDYLSFFCLGNREVRTSGEYKPEERPNPDTDYERAQQARRFMIYVHAKMMIVDDEYIIIGSANINQRSMDGGRDSEIAMGAYQPDYLMTTKQPAKGQIHGFRLALWFEHLQRLDDDFLLPQSRECVRKVNQIAERNWNLYVSDTLYNDLPGHLLSYPMKINGDGELADLPGMEFFPDTKARVRGTKSDYLPPILTT